MSDDDLAPSSPDSETVDFHGTQPKAPLKAPMKMKGVVLVKMKSKVPATKNLAPPAPAKLVGLQFAKSETEKIPMPHQNSPTFFSQAHQVIGGLRVLGSGKYRVVDCFFAASELFNSVLRETYSEQLSKRKSDTFSFMWKNSGPVAENFAIACDMAKALFEALKKDYANLMPTENKWMSVCVDYWTSLSKIPVAHLNREKYQTKLADWQKGGTRYTKRDDEEGHTIKSNVRFPDATERKKKLEQYMLAKQGRVTAVELKQVATKVNSVIVDIDDGSIREINNHAVLPSTATTAPRKGRTAKPTTEIDTEQQLVVQHVHQLLGSSMKTKHDEEIRRATAFFPKLSHKASQLFALRVLSTASRRQQTIFELEGGVVALKEWLTQAMIDDDELHFMTILETVCGLKCAFREETRLAWQQPKTGMKRTREDVDDPFSWIKLWAWKSSQSSVRINLRNAICDKLMRTLSRTKEDVQKDLAKEAQRQRENDTREARLRVALTRISHFANARLRGLGSLSSEIEMPPVPPLPNGCRALPRLALNEGNGNVVTYDVHALLDIEPI